MIAIQELNLNSQENQLRQIICRQHQKTIEKMCLAFECKNHTRLLCIDCCLDNQKHQNHREQIVNIDKMSLQSKQVMEELKYRGIEKKELQKLNELQFDKIIEEIWDLMQDGLRQVLARGREAIRKLNEHIEAANSDDIDEIFGGISLASSPMQKKNQNEIERVLDALFQYSLNRNESIFEQKVNSYLQDMYRKQKLSREIIVPDLQKDIRQRLHGYAKDMLNTCDQFIQNNIIENNNEIIRNEGISIQAPFKSEIVRDFNDLQNLIHKNDETINSLVIQRRVSVYENIEDAFHIIPPYVTKINYLLDTDSRNFFQKIKYIPPTVKMLEISGKITNFDAFKLPKSIQNLKLSLKQMPDLSKVIDGFIRYTPQKLQSLRLSFQNCQISKSQVNHLIQSFKYLPNTLKTYCLCLRENYLISYSIIKLILYTRYLPKSVHKMLIDVSNQFGNSIKLDEFPQYEVLRLVESFPKTDIYKKLNDEKLQKANLYYGVDQSQLEYSFVRELTINLSQNPFEDSYNFFCMIIFKLILNSCGLDNKKCEIIAKLILELPDSVKIVELSINNNTFDHIGLQDILKAIELKKKQLSNFILHFENCGIGIQYVNMIKEFIVQQQIHLEIKS